MKLAWIKWAGGIETRDDGYVVYHNLKAAILRSPNGKLENFITVEAAKREVDLRVSEKTKGLEVDRQDHLYLVKENEKTEIGT